MRKHRLLSKFNYLDFTSVKYSNQLRMALSDGRNAHEHSTSINPSNSAF